MKRLSCKWPLAFVLAIASLLAQAQAGNGGATSGNAPASDRGQPTTGGAQQAGNRLPALPAPDSVQSASDQVMPLSPDEIRNLRKRLSDSKRAASEKPSPTRPVLCSKTIDLSPGATPPIIRVTAGHGAVLTFYDMTGAEWPIKAIKNFNGDDFGVEQMVQGGAILTVEAKSEFGQGNFGVALEGTQKAIAVTVIAGQMESDYQCDMRVPARGPKAKPEPVPLDSKPVFSAYLSQILDGVAPPEAKPLTVTGGVAQAWLIGSQMIIRTRMTVLSPAHQGRLSSPDGTHVYEVPFMPVVLASDDGQERQLLISGD